VNDITSPKSTFLFSQVGSAKVEFDWDLSQHQIELCWLCSERRLSLTELMEGDSALPNETEGIVICGSSGSGNLGGVGMLW
jgi:hypothetical protein